MNNKGFMMAEVVITCSIVVITLVGLFTSYNRMYVKYQERTNYYNVDNSYACNYLKNILIEEGILYANTSSYYQVDNISDNKITYLKNSYDIESAIVIDLTKENDITKVITDDMNTTYKEYIKYLSNNIIYDLKEEKYLLIVERVKEVNGINNYYYGNIIF